MRLNSQNKKAAGIKPHHGELGKKHEPSYWDRANLPDYMEEYIAKLPPSSQNNAKKIVRSDFRRILKLNPMTAAKILAEKYDMHPDIDRMASDYGGPLEREETPEERAFWADMPPNPFEK